MNEQLFLNNICFLSLFTIPMYLVFIKMIIHLFLYIKDNAIDSSYAKLCKKLKNEQPTLKYAEAAKILHLDKKYNKLHNYYPTVLKFIRRNLILDSNNWYTVASPLSVVIGFFMTIAILINYSDYHDQKLIYDNGNFTCITKYYKYESLPQWANDAYSICKEAEVANSKFFTEKGTFKYDDFKYLLKDEVDKIHIIDTNKIWHSFLKTDTLQKDLILLLYGRKDFTCN